MTEEIISRGEFVNKGNKTYLVVEITNEALSQINKIILGDQIDEDDTGQLALREQVHQDCLKIFKEFN